jgi:hypothetical protein
MQLHERIRFGDPAASLASNFEGRVCLSGDVNVACHAATAPLGDHFDVGIENRSQPCAHTRGATSGQFRLSDHHFWSPLPREREHLVEGCWRFEIGGNCGLAWVGTLCIDRRRMGRDARSRFIGWRCRTRSCRRCKRGMRNVRYRAAPTNQK